MILRASIVAPSPSTARERCGTCARLESPPLRTPWRSPRRCGRMGAWMDGGSPSGSKSFAVPISKFQSDVLRLLATQRSPDSYIAGGVAINRQGPRFSRDIDIFHDSEVRQETAVKADEAALAR